MDCTGLYWAVLDCTWAAMDSGGGPGDSGDPGGPENRAVFW